MRNTISWRPSRKQKPARIALSKCLVLPCLRPLVCIILLIILLCAWCLIYVRIIALLISNFIQWKSSSCITSISIVEMCSSFFTTLIETYENESWNTRIYFSKCSFQKVMEMCSLATRSILKPPDIQNYSHYDSFWAIFFSSERTPFHLYRADRRGKLNLWSLLLL